MSQYRGNDEKCPHCELKYKDLRTGFSYTDIYAMFWRCSEDKEQWRDKRRGSILGLWHQIKQETWAAHIEECAVPF